MSLVSVNGRLLDDAQPQLHAADRGFQLGDGIFETLRAKRGVAIEWGEHVERLLASAATLSIPLGPDFAATLAASLGELLAAAALDDAAVRITVSRGVISGRGTLPAGWTVAEPTVVIQAFPYAPPPARLLADGSRLITSAIHHDVGSPLAGVKSTSRADHVYAKLEAERAGADDALFLTADGRVSEATSANVFTITGDRIATPPLAAGVLAGTTRTWLLAHSADLGLVAEERDLRPEDVLAADEAVLSSSVAGIVPFVALDGRPIGTGRPGSRSIALRAAREHWIEDCSRGSPSR